MGPQPVGRALALVVLWVAVARAEAIVYLSKDGADLRPGKNNSYAGT